MSILQRYIGREILTTFIAVILILISILLTQRLALYLNEATSGGLSQSAILSLVGLQVIRFLAELLPLSFLLASIIAFGRLYKDSEMAALFALGMPIKTLYQILLLLAIPLMIIITLLNFWVVPEVAKTQDIVLHKARESAKVTVLKPGVFKSFANKHTVYVESISNKGEQLNNVFIHSKEYSGNREVGYSVTTARYGEQLTDEEGARFVVLKEGSRFTDKEGVREKLYFQHLTLRLEAASDAFAHKALSLSTKELIEEPQPKHLAELHRRIAGPLSVLILILMIPALAHSRPREGQFNKLIVALILYVIYFNLLGIGQSWIERGRIAPIFGLWWAHAIMLIVGLIIARLHHKQV